MKTVAAYIPVLHQGYLDFLSSFGNDVEILVFGKTFCEHFPKLRKDIRTIDPELVVKALKSIGYPNVRVVEYKELIELSGRLKHLIMPEDEISSDLADRFVGCTVGFESVFLRWDSKNSTRPQAVFAEARPATDFERAVFHLSYQKASKSSDWYRKIGAAAVKDGEVIVATFNRHLPSEHAPYFNNDPRSNFSKGINIEVTTAAHAEIVLVSESAKRGLALEGTDLYVTTFPCPVCAKVVALSGFHRMFFVDGYSMLDGQEVIKTAGIEIIRVQL